MNIALHDSDATSYPNLVLMKLSAWHKANGDNVQLFSALESGLYDRVYSSKVFSFTDPDPYLPPDAVKGGTGYGDLTTVLSDEIEHIRPDYSLYGLDYSLGFVTRGCNRKCTWCNVPNKEGPTKPHADIEEFLDHGEVVLMDNNILQSDHGIRQIEKIAKLGIKVDFNQGLDARHIDDSVARLLSKVKFRDCLRIACDFPGMKNAVTKAVTALRWHNVTPRRYFVYTIIQEIEQSVDRIRFVKGLDLDMFAQPDRGRDGLTQPTDIQKHLARWCNHKAENKSRTWEEYASAHGVILAEDAA